MPHPNCRVTPLTGEAAIAVTDSLPSDLRPIDTAIVAKVLDQLRNRAARDCIEPHLAPPEIAKALRVDPATVFNWIRSGELRARKLGKGTKRPRYRVVLSALERFLESREMLPPRAKRQRGRESPSKVDWVAMMNLVD